MFQYTQQDFKNYLEEHNIPYIQRMDGFPNMIYKNMRKLYENHKRITQRDS